LICPSVPYGLLAQKQTKKCTKPIVDGLKCYGDVRSKASWVKKIGRGRTMHFFDTQLHVPTEEIMGA